MAAQKAGSDGSGPRGVRVLMRRAAAILLVLVAAIGYGVEAVEGRGPFATPITRHLRAMKDRVEPPEHYEDIRPESFARLPARLPLRRFAPLEQRGVRVEGYVRTISRSFDGDFHLGLVADRAEESLSTARAVTAEITPQWHGESTRWTLENLARAFDAERVTSRWTLARTFDPRLKPGSRHDPPRVRLSGWLMYDFWYDATPGWVFEHTHRLSGWEVHPVTRIEVWNEARKSFVDIPSRESRSDAIVAPGARREPAP